MPATAGVGVDQSQEPGMPSRVPRCMEGAQALEPSSVLSQSH